MKFALLAALLLSSCHQAQATEFKPTKEEIRTCSVIVDQNKDVCDPDGDIQNGDIDAA